MRETEVLVAGAGPTGLALAIWLTKLGVRVRIVDKNAGPAPFSRALGVQARTLEFYRQLGDRDCLSAQAVAGGRKASAINLWTRGRRRAHVPFGELGRGLTPFPFVLMYPQDEHERLLIAQLRSLGVTVERETELLSFACGEGTVRAVLARDGAQEPCEAAYLAGCDGAHSTVREALGTGFPGGTYSRIFYVADVNASGNAIDGELHVELGESDLLAIFPMKGEGRVRLVGTVRENAMPRDRDLSFDDVSKRAIEQLKLTVSSVNWFSTYRVHHRVAECFRSDRVFLLGDAAHVHSPVGAQGMNTGIGDAVNLAWKLAAVLRGNAGEAILDTYDSERRAFARRLVASTDRIFSVATTPGVAAAFARMAVVPRVAPVLFRLRAVRRLLFRTVSQIGIEYRNSALSAGRAGAVRGGDRLPWFEDGDASNADPLRALTWQAHVYGQARARTIDACRELRLPLHAFAWSKAAKRAGFRRGALYLVRPDGYVALADRSGNSTRLRAYVARQVVHSVFA